MIPKRLSVLWINYRQARFFAVDRKETLATETIESGAISAEVRNTAVALSSRKVRERLSKFYNLVARHLQGHETILVMGPGRAKEEFMDHLEEFPDVRKRIIAVETVKHSGDEVIIHQARKYMQ